MPQTPRVAADAFWLPNPTEGRGRAAPSIPTRLFPGHSCLRGRGAVSSLPPSDLLHRFLAVHSQESGEEGTLLSPGRAEAIPAHLQQQLERRQRLRSGHGETTPNKRGAGLGGLISFPSSLPSPPPPPAFPPTASRGVAVTLFSGPAPAPSESH